METPEPKPDMDKVESDLRVDLSIFRLSMDRDDEAFLRKKLSRASFSRIKRLRIRVAWTCVHRIARHAAQARRTAKGLRHDSNVDVAKAATKLMDLAWYIRWQCRIAFAKLAVEYMFPAMSIRQRT